MTQTDQPTAILFFSHSARAAAAASPFQARAVSSLLVRKTAKLAQKTGIPTFFFSEKQQRGSTFGARFANAFSSVFEKGFDRVIAIGHDCPTIKARDLTEAAGLLEKNGVVFGPASDGGAWLIGLQKSVFEKNTFEKIGWQTDQVIAELTNLFEKNGISPQFLTEKGDLDSATDLRRAIETLPFILKRTILRLLMLVFVRPFGREAEPLNRAFLAVARPLRAPPGR